MKGVDLINAVLSDELMILIFGYLKSNGDREDASLVCKRWLGLVRLCRETIHIGFSESTDDLVQYLVERFVNVRRVTIDDSPITPLPLENGRERAFDLLPHCARRKNANSKPICLSNAGLAVVADGFKKLESLKLIRCPNVTRLGFESIAEKCKLLKSIYLEELRIECDVLGAIGEHCTRLEDLSLYNCKYWDWDGLIKFALYRGRTLKSLGLHERGSLSDESLETIGSHFGSLESLSLTSEFISNEHLVSIAKGCPGLKSLRLQCGSIEDEALEAVAKHCLELEFLALYFCEKLTDMSLCALAEGCKKLKNLSLWNCDSVSDVGLDFVAVRCQELMHLELNECINIRTGGLESIGQSCTRLCELVLYGWKSMRVEIDALSGFGIGCKYLQSLELSNCFCIRDEAFSAIIRGCKNMKKLSIFHSSVGDEGIISVGQNCKYLTDLVIRLSDRVSDAGVIAIAGGCPQLSYLDVGGLENISDRALVAVSEGCLLLRNLKISNCPNITDVGLTSISGKCSSLEACNMFDCPAITETGVATFITGCQKLKMLMVEEEKFSPRARQLGRPRLIFAAYPYNPLFVRY